MATQKSSKSERAAALLAEQQRGERRRQYVVVAGVVAVLALIAGLTWYAMSTDKTGATNSSTPSGAEDYGVVVGSADAATEVTIYEDPQCPICGQFESAVGDQLATAIDDGKLRVTYRLVSFLDRASTNDYSSRAANAAFAVADQAGAEGFRRFHELLFANQPAEGGAGPDDEQLIAWAVQAGADEAKVSSMIKDKVFDQYVVDATDAMSKNDVTATPTVFIDGKKIEGSPQDSVDAILKAIG